MAVDAKRTKASCHALYPMPAWAFHHTARPVLNNGESVNTPDTEQSPHLAEYYYVLTKHKWTVVVCLVVVVTMTMLFTFLMRPVYRATTTLVIERERSTSPLTGERLDYESYLSESMTFNTHFKLITSRPVLEQVIRDLNLDKLETEKGIEVNPVKELLGQFKTNMGLLLGWEENPRTPEEKMTEVTEKLERKIDIEQPRDTRLLKIGVDDHDRSTAVDIANSLARTYIEFNIGSRLTSSQNTLSWMTDQLYQMKKKLEDAEKEFLSYKQREKLFSVKGRQKVIAQKVEEFNDAYIKARNRRLEVDAKLEKLGQMSSSGADALHFRSLLDNPLIDTLYGQLLESEVQLSKLSKVYRSKHPKVIQIETKIDNTRKKLQDELTKEVENLKAERSVLLDREEVLQKTMAEFEKDALDTNRKELKYTILERNVETNQKLYDTLLSKIKESNIVGSQDVSNIRVAEQAVMPEHPVKPKKKLNLVLSIIFGLMTGAGLAFLWEYLDRTLHTEEDVQRYLDLTVLSVIPEIDLAKRRGHTRLFQSEVPPEGQKGEHREYPALSSLFVENHPITSSFAESYRTLRTNIRFSFMESGLRSLLVTSAGEEEGKSSTVANLAYTMVQAGRSVLMIDADLRKPSLSHLVPFQESRGLTGLLTDVFSSPLQRGSLKEVSVGDLFRLLSLQNKTGLLHLSEGTERLDLLFLQGELADLNWITRPKDKRLASHLVKDGLLTREQATQAMRRQRDTGQKLGFLLISSGLVKKEDLRGPLTIHMMEGLKTALDLKGGTFSFKELLESDIARSSSDLVDFPRLYQQFTLGEETIPYLQKMINASIIHTSTDDLFLLPTGGIPPNPSELLGSERMSFLISNLKKRFDVLVIDSPPTLPASDALLLAPDADGVILMVRAGNLNREMVKKSIEQLRMAKANLLGVVLSQVDIKKEGYYKYYHRYYSKYYGEEK
jgi:succinoglycan biosynthesis transport protein ExoP